MMVVDGKDILLGYTYPSASPAEVNLLHPQLEVTKELHTYPSMGF
ncbi:hypothetical protein FIU95_13465 [Microbulbifer sp. THAF38]|nr:hypothetical protein FIU95_13465 [Microbulbifer sp. THAF38]